MARPLKTETGGQGQFVRVGTTAVAKKLGCLFWPALLWLTIVALCALFADLLPLRPYDSMDLARQAAPPNLLGRLDPGGVPGAGPRPCDYLLGTDTMGRDMLSRLVFGARVSLLVGMIPPLIGLVAGGMLGLVAGYYQGRVGSIIMAAMDTILAFPGLVLLLAATFYLGQDLATIITALGVLTIPAFSRVARAGTLALARQEYIKASQMIGLNDGAILLRDILPNILPSLAVYGLFVASYMIVAEGSLSFLGLGVPAPVPSWGGMIAEGREVLAESGHVSFLPGFVMFLTVLSLNLTGDALRHVLDAQEGQL